jgi:hypothetical protein
VTQQLIKRIILIGSERLQKMLLSHDDYNYAGHNDEIFNTELPINEVSFEDDDEEDT